jgi:hypothetical protein
LTEHGSPSNYNAEITCTSPREGSHVFEGSSPGIQEDLQMGGNLGSELEEESHLTSEDQKKSKGNFFFFFLF